MKLTAVLFKFFTLQFKYAALPSKAVTFLEAALSKYGPTLNASKSRAFCLEPYAPGLLSLELDESRCDAEAVKNESKNNFKS